MKISEGKIYFNDLLDTMLEYCNDKKPLVFVLASSYLDYLSKMAYGKDRKAEGYKYFIKDYLSKIRPKYKDFIYKSGNHDLPEQIYHVLRCGIIHSFSLVPDEQSIKCGGRKGSIVLCHEEEALKKNSHI